MNRTPEHFRGSSVDPPHFPLRQNTSGQRNSPPPANGSVTFITNYENVATQGYARDQGGIDFEQPGSSVNVTNHDSPASGQQQESSAATSSGGSRNMTFNFNEVKSDTFVAYQEH